MESRYRKPQRRPVGATLDGMLRQNSQRTVRQALAERPRRPVVQPSSKSPTQPSIPRPAVSPQRPTNSLINLNLSGATPLSKRYRRAKKQRKPHGFWWWSRRVTATTFLLLILTGGFLFGKGYMKFHQVFKGGAATAVALKADKADPNLLKGEGDGRINILLLGKGGDGHEGPDLTDTLLVASIDPINHSAALVSVPRDLWVNSPAGGSSKINAVYANAKSKALAKAPRDAAGAETAGETAAQQIISQVLGIPIHYYGMVDFTAFKEAVDTVGGVTLNVPQDLIDPTMAWENNWSAVLARQGAQTFDGKHALLYVRSRHGSARGDFDRAERQRLLIVALQQKILSAGTYANPLKLSQLMSTFGNHVSTDISTSDAGRLLSIFKNLHGDIASVGLSDPPHDYLTTGAYAGQSIVQPKAGLGNYTDIQAYIRTTLRDGYLVKENATVAVLNGSAKPGAAQQQASLLQSYGYTIGTVGEASTHDYAKTTIVDLTGGTKKYTKAYLEKRFGVKATTKLPANSAISKEQFVIIVGQNETVNR